MQNNDNEAIDFRKNRKVYIIAINEDSLNSFNHTCNKYDIQPTSIFTSSVTGKTVTYAKFETSSYIKDSHACYLIHGCLKRLFNNYKDIRTFKKELEKEYDLFVKLLLSKDKTYTYKSKSALIDPSYLFFVACFAVYNKASKKNESKTLTAFLTAIDLDGYALSKMQFEKKSSKLTDPVDAYIYILRESIKNVSYNKNTSKDESVNVTSLISEHSSCLLLKDLISKSRTLSLQELRHLANSLYWISNAQTSFVNSIENTGLYDDDIHKLIDNLMSSYRKLGINSPNCTGFCSHHSECNSLAGHKVTYLEDVLPQKEGTIHQKRRSRVYKDVDIIRTELSERFNNDLCSDENSTFVYKCFPGVGKTEMYLLKINEFIEQEKTVIIALPTHKLKDDIISRLNSLPSNDLIAEKVIIIPELPMVDDEVNKELKFFYAIGDYNGAKELIRKYKDSLAPDNSILLEDLENYLNITANLKNKEYTNKKIIFTTHERLFSLKSVKPDLVIIDEDITSSILKINTSNTAELSSLRLLLSNLIEEEKNQFDGIITDKINEIINTGNEYFHNIYCDTKNNDKLRKAIIDRISIDKGKYYKSKFIDLFINDCTYIKIGNMKTNVAIINYIYKREFPFNNCKLFIMSATADKEIYERLFEHEKVVFYEPGIPKLQASITMKYNYSYSKNWFKDDDEDMSKLDDLVQFGKVLRDKMFSKEEKKIIDRKVKNQPLIITFKKFEKYFKDLEFENVEHFGNTTGINYYKGKNTLIYGTYNKPSLIYALYTKAIFTESQIDKLPYYGSVLVENEDCKFYIYTSPEYSEFRKIHLWSVESETIQALGRSRPIDNDCIIRIYSNVPPAGIEITFIK